MEHAGRIGREKGREPGCSKDTLRRLRAIGIDKLGGATTGGVKLAEGDIQADCMLRRCLLSARLLSNVLGKPSNDELIQADSV